MILTLIGMSNSGKSHLSKALKKKGFSIIDCDQEIAKKLHRADVSDVATWMGLPYEPQYKERSAAYLSLERDVMRDITGQIQAIPKDTHVVIDTTGSVIYTGDDIGLCLREHTTVISLSTPDHVQKDMFDSYIRHPKPVIWGDVFFQKPHESPEEALARCYPELLAYRIKKYQDLSHISLDYVWLRDPRWDIEDVLQRI